MAIDCVGDSVTMISDVSTRYLSDTATLEYYDDLLPLHLSPLTDLSRFHGSNEMSFTYGDGTFYPLPKAFTSFPRLSSGATYSTNYPVVLTNNNRIEPSCTEQSLRIPGIRTSTFHRSASIADLRAGRRMQNLDQSRIGLRRTPRSTYDLRKCAEQEDQTAESDQYLQTHPTQKLQLQRWLPTPSCQNEYEQRRTRRKFQYKSYQDLHILSMYQENGSLLSLNSIRQPQSATIESGSEASESTESSPQSSPRPQTPSDNHFPQQTFWNKDRDGDEKRLRRIGARQVHVIEHDLDVDEGEDEIKQATVLIGPGKPRLIQIHRPIRPCHSPKLQHHDNATHGPEPVTPAHNKHDTRSLFSPQTTPEFHGPPSTNLSMPTSTNKRIPAARHQLGETSSTNRNMHTSIGSTPPRKLSVSSSSTILSLNGRSESYSHDPFGDRWSHSSTQSCNTSILDDGSPGPTHPSAELRQTTAKHSQRPCDQPYRAELHCQSLISAITSTGKALDALAGCNFDLTSPILTSFRRKPRSTKGYNTTDYVLIAHLNKIFAHSSLTSLSVLAAWLVVDSHYTQLFSSAPCVPEIDSDPCNDQEHSPPIRSDTKLPHITVSAATSPTFSIRPYSRTTISTPLYASNIPSKARSILGIPASNPSKVLPQPTSVRCNSQVSNKSSLDNRHSSNSSPSPSDLRRAEGKARIVHASVQVVGRKLIADLLAEKNKSMHSWGKPGIGSKKGRNVAGNGAVVDDVAVNALWEACRCIASLE